MNQGYLFIIIDQINEKSMTHWHFYLNFIGLRFGFTFQRLIDFDSFEISFEFQVVENATIRYQNCLLFQPRSRKLNAMTYFAEGLAWHQYR